MSEVLTTDQTFPANWFEVTHCLSLKTSSLWVDTPCLFKQADFAIFMFTLWWQLLRVASAEVLPRRNRDLRLKIVDIYFGEERNCVLCTIIVRFVKWGDVKGLFICVRTRCCYIVHCSISEWCTKLLSSPDKTPRKEAAIAQICHHQLSQQHCSMHGWCMYYINYVLDWKYGGVLIFPCGHSKHCSKIPLD